MRLQGFKEEIDGLQEELDAVQNQGAELMTACGEPDKPFIKKSIDEVACLLCPFTPQLQVVFFFSARDSFGKNICNVLVPPGEFGVGEPEQELERKSGGAGGSHAGRRAVPGRHAGIWR